jgi:hypothetical protein
LPRHDFRITQDTIVLIKHQSSFDLEKFWGYVSTITGFLTLAYFSDTQILKIQFKQSRKLLTCNYLGQNTVEPKRKKSHRHFLFEYAIIKEDFMTIFKKWSELKNVIKPVVDVIHETFAKRNIIAENKFLNITRHRNFSQKKKE